MTTGLTNYAENKLTDAILRAQSLGAPTTLYVALLKCSKGIAARSTAYALNDTVVVSTSNGRYQFYKVTTAGTTAGSAPSYPGVAGEAITDGTAVLTEQAASLDDTTAFSEPTPGSLGYNRQSITAALANWSGTQSAGSTAASSGTGGQSSNNGSVAFGPSSTTGWAVGSEMIWGFAIYDAATSGNAWLWGALTNPTGVVVGVTITFAAGSLTVTLS
jgi:uncharacterized protein YfiM (DUF2279 family)